SRLRLRRTLPPRGLDGGCGCDRPARPEPSCLVLRDHAIHAGGSHRTGVPPAGLEAHLYGQGFGGSEMKKANLLCAALLAISATVASAAAGVNIRWDNCFGEGTGAPNKSFACDVNTGSSRLVFSFVLGGDLLQVDGNQ